MHPARPQGARRSSRGTVRSARPRTRIMSTAATISSAPRPARRATSSSRPGHRGLTPGDTVEPCAVSDDLDALQGALLRWYGRERRDLPWRRTTDPYAILVSEVMLQQTQVTRVVPRYLEWLDRWSGGAGRVGALRARGVCTGGRLARRGALRVGRPWLQPACAGAARSGARRRAGRLAVRPADAAGRR